MNKHQFIIGIKNLHSAESVRDRILYTIESVNEAYVRFAREGKQATEKISMDELYNLFNHQGKINTSVARKYISGRVQSPATAFVLKMKSIYGV